MKIKGYTIPISDESLFYENGNRLVNKNSNEIVWLTENISPKDIVAHDIHKNNVTEGIQLKFYYE